jgi:hypothetical protein
MMGETMKRIYMSYPMIGLQQVERERYGFGFDQALNPRPPG